jgi:hypothetical protein
VDKQRVSSDQQGTSRHHKQSDAQKKAPPDSEGLFKFLGWLMGQFFIASATC